MSAETGRDLVIRCCVVGGGPAGMVLGVLLARAGVRVAVLEKHADFLRDFRGDTVHPSTLEILEEMGLLERFLALPQQRVDQLRVYFGEDDLALVDFRGLARFPYLALVPQWDFLDLLADEGRRHPSFSLHMRTEATGLVLEHDRVVGVDARGPEGPLRIRADLIVATDGRDSTLRNAAGLEPEVLGAPMDVLWFRISRRPNDPPAPFGRIGAGQMMVLINRGDYWQAAYLVPKGTAASLRAAPVEEFQQRVAGLVGFLADRVVEVRTWGDVSLLEVRVDRLRRWHLPGLLLIGDAAHAMSPIGGVGINLAIQDAVAAANELAGPLAAGRPIDEAPLARIASRRLLPTRVIQRIQVVLQRRVVAAALQSRDVVPRLPRVVRWLLRFRAVRSIPARLFGLGIRREHVRTPAPPPAY
jgi:2-polyprenyl-6-methoxyphenol hydroxylase-like FAD-dependent oxidoreductase